MDTFKSYKRAIPKPSFYTPSQRITNQKKYNKIHKPHPRSCYISLLYIISNYLQKIHTQRCMYSPNNRIEQSYQKKGPILRKRPKKSFQKWFLSCRHLSFQIKIAYTLHSTITIPRKAKKIYSNFISAIPSMYKRLSLDELTNINTKFFKNIHTIYTKRKHTFFKAFLRELMVETSSHYFLEWWRPLFRIQHLSTDEKWNEQYRFVDEEEKIECFVDNDWINTIHNLLKNIRAVDKIAKENKTIIEGLFDRLESGELQYIMDKPYVTYDIETTFDGEGHSHQHFEMAYSVSTDDISNGLTYSYIDRTSMQRYCDYLLEYPGRIIWYNQIWFDNPVLIHNCWYGQTELDILNKKSIDPFLFFHKLLKRRLKLSKIAESLVSSGKTLESWAEWANLLQEYKRTGDKKALRKVKKYCKNDVRITLWVFLYLLSNNKVHIEGETKEFDLNTLIQRGSARNLTTATDNDKTNNTQDWFF